MRHESAEAPATHAFELPGIADPLQVWDGTAEFVFPVYASSALGRVIRDGATSISVDVTVRYQACDDVQCFMPRTRTLRLEVPVGLGAMPNFGEMRGITGHTVEMDAKAHMKRLLKRNQAD